jgi:preprotein translocase subunit YajC
MDILMSLVPLAIMIGVFYFLLIRPQSKQRKLLEQKINNLGKGDKFLTQGGLYCTVVSIKDNLVVGKIGNGVKIEVNKAYIANVVDGGGATAVSQRNNQKVEEEQPEQIEEEQEPEEENKE